jgi:hypothetical protein
MKTEKEKAEEIVNKFSPILPWYTKLDNLRKSKQCALICVDEIRKSCLSYDYNSAVDANYYWNNVEEEIQKL